MAMKEIKNETEHYYLNDNGNRHGEYKSFYSNRDPDIQANYDNDKLHGEYKRWHENGKPDIHANYLNDKYHGEYKRWFSNGKPDVHTIYDEGIDLGINPSNIDEKEKFILTLKHNVVWL